MALHKLEDHRKLIYLVINRKMNMITVGLKQKKYLSMDDVEQAGMIGLWKATKMFNPSMKRQFSTYAYYWIQGEIMNLFRYSSPYKKKLDKRTMYITPPKKEDGTEYDNSSEVKTKDDDSELWVNEFISSLDDKQRELLYYRMNKFRLKEIEEKMGLVKSSLHWELKKIRKKYKQYDSRRKLV